MKVALRKKGDTAAHAGSAGLGDIGTSPLYVLRTVFTLDNGAVRLDEDDITGVISCIIWVLILIVTLKYVCFVLRADNEGEGGILALATRVRRSLKPGRIASAVALLGVFGAALFFGDSVITPAISVLSAVEGLEVAFPTMATFRWPWLSSPRFSWPNARERQRWEKFSAPSCWRGSGFSRAWASRTSSPTRASSSRFHR